VFKGAEPAASNALVGEVDVSIYHKRDLILAALLAQQIGQAV
jgi:hypothetical protein